MPNTQRELGDSLVRASARAASAGRAPGVHDLLLALLDTPEVHLMIHRVGGDSDALASALDAAASSRPKPSPWERLRLKLGPQDAFRDVMAIAALRARAADASEVRAIDVFAAAFDTNDRALAAILESAGVSRVKVLRWILGGDDVAEVAPDGDRLEVVMLNDDFTPMETVVRVLKAVFGADAPTAYATMLAVHHRGRASLGRFDREEAIRLARAAMAMAEGEGAPLRVILGPEDGLGDLAVPRGADAAGPVSPPSPLLRAVSSDAAAIVYGIAALGVWLAAHAFWAVGPGMWFPSGVAGITWYGAGVFALAWIRHRASGAAGDYGHVLIAIARLLPLAVLLGVTRTYWAPDDMTFVYVLLALGALFYARDVARRVRARRPWMGVFAAAAFVALFTWGTQRAYVNARLWYPTTDDGEEEEDDDEWADFERRLFDQPDQIDAAASGLRGGDPDRPSVFFLGFAGTGEEKVFAEEAKMVERVVSERYGAAGRTLLLVNDRRDAEARPWATVSGLRRALVRLGERMDRSKDVLFLFLTSHGSKQSLAVSNETWPLEQLDPATLRRALDASGIKWRVVVISACHSGAFIPALADDNTAIFTAAAADRVSFGCSDDRDVTEFGAALFRDALPRAGSLTAAFEQAKKVLAEQEKSEKRRASRPQARFGTALAAHWEGIEQQHRRRVAHDGPSRP